jgi:hypothetical protein
MSWKNILKAKDKDWLRRQKVEERKRRKTEKKKKNIAAEEADEPRRREKRLTSTSGASRELERRWKEQEDKLVELLMTTTIPEEITDEPDSKKGYWLDTTDALYHEEFGTMAIPYENKHDAARFIHHNWWFDSPQTKRVGINKLINFLETL